LICIVTAANSHCPDGDGWSNAAVLIALIFAITVFQLAKLWWRK
jgi:hypothetical protein